MKLATKLAITCNQLATNLQQGERFMRIEAIAWFDMPDNGKWHGQNVMPQKELIRCKDCRYWQCDDYESYCDELGIFGTDMNSYCSYAKRG